MRRLRNRDGQTMTEMIIIVALIAIASIVIVGLFGDSIRATFSRMTGGLAGKAEGAGAVNAAYGKAATEGSANKGMAGFDAGIGGGAS